MNEERSLRNKGCFPKVSNGWMSVFSDLTSANRVHPSNPVPPKDSEFVLLDSKLKIRVIHKMPDNNGRRVQIEQVASNRSSVSEEYWFMRHKPLRTVGNCNCSFRTSIRKSFRQSNCSDESFSLKPSERHENSTNNRAHDVKSYVDQLIEDTLRIALTECINNRMEVTYGIDNPACDVSQVDSIVTKIDNNLSANLKHCVHKRVKPLILFIHGLGSTADIWNVLMNSLLMNGFEVVALDLLGHGYSSAPNKASYYHFKSLLKQVVAVFDYFMNHNEDRKCILIGHSYGCSLITALYPNRAAQIGQLILISGGGPTPLAPTADVKDISPYGCVHNFCFPFMYCGLKRSFFYSLRGKNFKFCQEESAVPPHIKQYLIEGQYWPEGDASFHRRILVPTLLIYGLQDKNVTLVQECEMERTVPRSFLELIPNAGHMSMLESPEQLNHMVLCFIKMWT